MLAMVPAWQPVAPKVFGATAAACRDATPPRPRRDRGRKEEPTRPESRPSATIQRSSRAGDMASPCGPHTGLARSTSGSPLDPAPFRQDEPGVPQRHARARRPLCSAARALTPTEPGGETRVEATCVNARRRVGTDPGSIPGASAYTTEHFPESSPSFIVACDASGQSPTAEPRTATADGVRPSPADTNGNGCPAS